MHPTNPTYAQSLLPAELWDEIIDIIAFEKDSRGHLIRLTRVCRLLRPRALARILRSVSFSQMKTELDNPYALLDSFDSFPGYYEDLPRTVELGCIEFDIDRTLSTRTLKLLPQLRRLERLTICDLQLSGNDLPNIAQWLFESVTTLTLEGGDYDDVALNAFLGRFPRLESLSLSTSLICVLPPGTTTPLPFAKRCRLQLTLGGPYDDPLAGSMQWAVAQRAYFVLDELDFSPHTMPPDVLGDRLDVFGHEIGMLRVRLGPNPEQLGASAQAILRCRALKSLEVWGGRPSEVWTLLHAVRAHGPAMSRCRNFFSRLMFFNPKRDEQDLLSLEMFLEELPLDRWRIAHNNDELARFVGDAADSP